MNRTPKPLAPSPTTRRPRPSRRRCARVLALWTLLGASWGGPLAAQEPPFELEGLVVTGSATPRPLDLVSTHVTVLEGDRLRAAGLTSVSEALRDVPGLAVVRSGSFGAATSVFLRGGQSDYVLVLVDGVQVNEPGGAFDFSSLTLDDVERVEVVRGPASALYGSDAVAGVVHVVTRTGRGAPSASAHARAGSYGRRDVGLQASGGAPRAGWSLSLTRRHTDGILAFNNRHTNTVLSGAVRLAPDDRTRASLTLRLGEQRYHFPTDGSGALVDRNQFTFGDRATVSASVSRRVTDTWLLEALVGTSERDGGTDDQPDGPADTLGFYGFSSLDHVRRSSLELRSVAHAGPARVTVGGELEQQRQRSFNESSSQFGPSASRSADERDNRAAYTRIRLDQARWGMDGGVRVEDNERFGRHVTWEVGGAWIPDPDLTLRASVGRGLKEPTFFETFATGFAVGNPDLRPETTRSVEVGARVALARGRVRLDVTAFDQRFEDLIQYTPVAPAPGEPNYFNLASAEARGVEIEATARWADLEVRGGWTGLSTGVLEPGASEGPGGEFVEGDRLLRRPDRVLSGSLRRTFGSAGSVEAGLRSVGERSDLDFSTFPAERLALPAYTVVWLGGLWRVGDRLHLTGRADNLLDETYEEVLGFPAPGRTLEVGVGLRFGGGG